jgi:hypothetical protein
VKDLESSNLVVLDQKNQEILLGNPYALGSLKKLGLEKTDVCVLVRASQGSDHLKSLRDLLEHSNDTVNEDETLIVESTEVDEDYFQAKLLIQMKTGPISPDNATKGSISMHNPTKTVSKVKRSPQKMDPVKNSQLVESGLVESGPGLPSPEGSVSSSASPKPEFETIGISTQSSLPSPIISETQATT